MRITATNVIPVSPYFEPDTQPVTSTALATVETPKVPAPRTNWGQNQLSRPDAIICPDSLEGLQKEIVKAVTSGETPVVIRGSMHSWSPVAIQDKGTAINLWKMVEAPTIDTENQIVHVSAGMKLGALYDHLDKEGLTLAYKPTINDATVAGALATGTHGASRDKGLLADQVIGVKLIDSRGRKILVDEQGCHEIDDNGKIKTTLIAGPMPLREMKLHRGVLGVIYEISMKCVPAYDLELVQTPMYEDDAFGLNYSKLIEHMNQNEHADFFWFVPDERVIMRGSNKTTEPRKPRNPIAKVILDDFARSKMATLAMQFIRYFPSAARPIGWVAARTFISPIVIRDRSDIIASYLPGHAESASQFQAMEYGVPYEKLTEAIDIIRESVEGYEMPVPMYFRRVGEKLYFEFIWLRGFPGGKAYAKKLEANLIEAFGADAQPHEGKIYFQNPWNRVPEEKQKDFMKVKATLDPKNVFLNQYMAEYFSGKEDLTDSTTNR